MGELTLNNNRNIETEGEAAKKSHIKCRVILFAKAILTLECSCCCFCTRFRDSQAIQVQLRTRAKLLLSYNCSGEYFRFRGRRGR